MGLHTLLLAAAYRLINGPYRNHYNRVLVNVVFPNHLLQILNQAALIVMENPTVQEPRIVQQTTVAIVTLISYGTLAV